jgi:CDP-paratose 2-epimerase
MPPNDAANSAPNETNIPSTTATLGICQWFHFGDDGELDRAIALLDELGVRHLRTGVSWADYHRLGGRAWYDRQFAALQEAGCELLVSVWHTPPSLGEAPSCAAPPRRLRDYADFLDHIVGRYGESLHTIELWNEPNNRYKWDFLRFDPNWSKFDEMVGPAAYWAKQLGVRTVLGGISPVDRDWLERRADAGVLEHVDVLAIHSFPNMWWDGAPCWEQRDAWHGWDDKVAIAQSVADDRPVWVTETGLATFDLPTGTTGRFALQTAMLEAAVRAPVERLYWYSLIDLHPERSAIEGFHVDEHEYHMGLVTHHGEKKPAFERLKELVRRELVAV